jgi:hypothetical protein
MTKITASSELPTYQVIGTTLRIHWDQEQHQTEDDQTVWKMHGAKTHIHATRSEIIETIMKTHYPTPGSEFAAINNGGSDYEDYLNFRTFAKELADGWFEEQL